MTVGTAANGVVPDEAIRDLPYDRALELGCGTGFFLLNLIQAGVARRGSVTDLSPGMVKVATRNGQSYARAAHAVKQSRAFGGLRNVFRSCTLALHVGQTLIRLHAAQRASAHIEACSRTALEHLG